MDAWRCAKRRCARHSASRSAQTSSPTSAVREHFCAVADGDVVGSVSLKPLGPHGLQLRQMAVSEARRGMRIGARLLEIAELWARDQGFFLIVLNARMDAEGFYAKFGYRSEGGPFEENTIPHIRMTKRLR